MMSGKRLIKRYLSVRHTGLMLVCLAGLTTSVASVASAQSSALIYEGFTEATRDILVSGSELGRLRKIHVQMGDIVEQGQTLAQMDDVQQRAAVRLSQAQAEMTGDVDLAIAEERMHFDRFEKILDLAKRNMARPDEVKRQESQWKMASARVTQAREQQNVRQLQLERDQLQLERRRITAPTAGVIARVLHSEGEYITPADSAIIQLLKVDTLDGVFNIPAEEMNNVRIGKSVRVFLRSCSATVEGVIDRISPSIEGKSGTVQIRVRIENPDRKYLHGDRCTLRLELDSEADKEDSSRRSAFLLPNGPANLDASLPAKEIAVKPEISVVRGAPKVLVPLKSDAEQPSFTKPRGTTVATKSPNEPAFKLPTAPTDKVPTKVTPADNAAHTVVSSRKTASTIRLQPSRPVAESQTTEPKTPAFKASNPPAKSERQSISRAWLKQTTSKGMPARARTR